MWFFNLRRIPIMSICCAYFGTEGVQYRVRVVCKTDNLYQSTFLYQRIQIHECSPPCRTFMEPISKTSAGTFGFSEFWLSLASLQIPIRLLIVNTEHGAFRARGQDDNFRRWNVGILTFVLWTTISQRFSFKIAMVDENENAPWS
jgi:hypothetical protein